MYNLVLKPFIDRFFSLVLLLLLFPVFVLIAGILLFFNKGKVFFVQPRVGMQGKVFRIIKFKTMTDFCDEKGGLLPDHKRLTWVGSFLRKTSLDELPQLINVAKGDMSFIGPRPLLVEYLPLYNDFQKRRHEVMPGITGWAQVNGRNAITWDEKFRLDVHYVDNISFFFDIKILLLTFKKVCRSEGVNSTLEVTMLKFTGNK